MSWPKTGNTVAMAGTFDDTALGVAMARAREARCDCPLFTDPYSHLFLDAAAERGWRPPTGPIAERIDATSDYAASRTKWFDEFFIAAGANGIEQAVILAAGLDTRAWRLPWIDGSIVYEIDQPKVLAFKADTLRARDAQPAARHVAVLIDLQEDWPNALREAGFDSITPSAWSAEGLLAGQSAAGDDLLFDRLRKLSAPGSRIAIEAVGADVARRLTERGWDVSSFEAQELMQRYSRCGPDDADDVAPRTVFIQGNLVR
jgi:methyltransferase (TIGR00027 family)